MRILDKRFQILLPESFAAVYFWDAAANDYVAVNDDYADTNAPLGQGFFVKAASAGSISFNSYMQVHDGSSGFKAAALPRPTIKLNANNGTGKLRLLPILQLLKGFSYILATSSAVWRIRCCKEC